MFFSCLWLIIALSCAGTQSCTFYNFQANANFIHQFVPTFLVPWFFQCYSTLLTSVAVSLSSGKVTTITLEINVKVNCLNSQKTENALACSLTSERKEDYQFTQSLECFLQWWQEIANAEAGLSGPFSRTAFSLFLRKVMFYSAIQRIFTTRLKTSQLLSSLIRSVVQRTSDWFFEAVGIFIYFWFH